MHLPHGIIFPGIPDVVEPLGNFACNSIYPLLFSANPVRIGGRWQTPTILSAAQFQSGNSLPNTKSRGSPMFTHLPVELE